MDDGVVASLLPQIQPEGETKFRCSRLSERIRASRRLPLQSNRKRKGAPLIKTMRRFTEING